MKFHHNVRATPLAVRPQRFPAMRVLKTPLRFEPNHLIGARSVQGLPHRLRSQYCDANASGVHPIFVGIADAQGTMSIIPRRRELGRWRLSRIAAAGALDCPETETVNLNLKSVMLETIAIILIVLWLLGLVSSYTMGGFIHILLVAAIVVILVRVIQGRAP